MVVAPRASTPTLICGIKLSGHETSPFVIINIIIIFDIINIIIINVITIIIIIIIIIIRMMGLFMFRFVFTIFLIVFVFMCALTVGLLMGKDMYSIHIFCIL